MYAVHIFDKLGLIRK